VREINEIKTAIAGEKMKMAERERERPMLTGWLVVGSRSVCKILSRR
jgi:hypothetical protein